MNNRLEEIGDQGHTSLEKEITTLINCIAANNGLINTSRAADDVRRLHDNIQDRAMLQLWINEKGD